MQKKKKMNEIIQIHSKHWKSFTPKKSIHKHGDFCRYRAKDQQQHTPACHHEHANPLGRIHVTASTRRAGIPTAARRQAAPRVRRQEANLSAEKLAGFRSVSKYDVLNNRCLVGFCLVREPHSLQHLNGYEVQRRTHLGKLFAHNVSPVQLTHSVKSSECRR